MSRLSLSGFDLARIAPKTVLIVSLAVLTSVAGASDTSRPLDCLAGLYTEIDRSRIDTLASVVNGTTQRSETALLFYGLVADAAARSCARRLSWDEGQAYHARQHEVARLMELAYRAHGPLSDEGIARVDRTLASGNSAKMWSAMELSVSGEILRVSREEQLRAEADMRQFLVSAGFSASDPAALQAGDLLALMAVQRVHARQFGLRVDE